MLGKHSATAFFFFFFCKQSKFPSADSLNYPGVHAHFLLQKGREVGKRLVEHGAPYREPGATPHHLLGDKMPPNTCALNNRDRREQLPAAVKLRIQGLGMGSTREIF